MPVLIILAASQRQAESTEAMRAIDRYEGVFFRVLKKYLKEGVLRDVDILIITKTHGLISSEEVIPYEPNFTLKFLSKDTEKIRDQNLQTLGPWLSRKNYSEIYVNCGQEFMQLIKGFEKLTTSKITFAVGSQRGIGPKATHMKKWILELSDSMVAKKPSQHNSAGKIFHNILKRSKNGRNDGR